ncbi:MAG: HEAT repeat domain-containing protein [Candidatus Ozemobacteraceae bacterium]
MATSKSNLKTDQLLAALTGGDGTLVMNALAEIEDAPVSAALAQLLNSAIPKITDTVQAFQVRKSLKVLSLRLTGRVPNFSLTDLQKLLQQPDRFEEIAVAIAVLKPTDAVLASDLLRSGRWSEFPTPLLPSLCRFMKKYGNVADAASLIELCRNPDPTVLTTALEALEVVDPSDLPSLVTPLLTSPNAGIRAQAIQALYRWDKSAALRHLVAFLFSQNQNEQALALHHANSFPFAEVEPHLLRFISETTDTRLLMRVSQLMQVNAHPELPFRLYWISRSLKEQHQNLLKGIVLGVVRSLADAKKIQGTAQEFLDQLKLRVQREEERLLKESLSMTAPEPLAGEKSGPDHLSLPDLMSGDADVHASRGASGAGASPNHGTASAPATGPAGANLSLDDYDTLDATSRIQLLGRLTPEEYLSHKGKLTGLLKTAKGKEQAAVIKVVGRFGSNDGAPLLKPFLESDNADAICSTIDALTHLDAEYLGIYLPQLMQSRNGKVRMRATRAFVGIDRQQIKSLIAGMLQSSSSRQRAMVIPATMLVDFSLVRDVLLKAFEKEITPELIEKIGLVLIANPDRELLRSVLRAAKNTKSDQAHEAMLKVIPQIAEKLSVALGKISTPEELLAGEEAALKAEAENPGGAGGGLGSGETAAVSSAENGKSGAAMGASVKGGPTASSAGRGIPSKPGNTTQASTSDDEQAKTKMAKFTVAVFALGGVAWVGAIVWLIVWMLGGE